MSDEVTFRELFSVLLGAMLLAFLIAFLIYIPAKEQQRKAQEVCRMQNTYMIDGTIYACPINE